VNPKLGPLGIAPSQFQMTANPGNVMMQGTLQTGAFGPLGNLMSPEQVAAGLRSYAFSRGKYGGVQLGSSSGGKYEGNAANRFEETNRSVGIAPPAPAPLPPPPIPAAIDYAARDAALRSLATPAPAPAPAATPSGARASAAGRHQKEQ
jgi:hypothetical protein